MGRCAWFDCCRTDVELGLSSNGELEGNDNAGFSREWLDEVCELTFSQQEAEELRLQQLQIEQEIQELEQAQEQLPYFYIREIPNKPPPPYTPSIQTTRNPSLPALGLPQDLTQLPNEEEPHFIPSTAQELTSLTTDMTNYLYNIMKTGGNLDQAEVPVDINSLPLNDITKSSTRIFNKLVFDLTKDIVKETYSVQRDKPSASWEWPAFPQKTNMTSLSKNKLQEIVVKQVLDLFGFLPKPWKEKYVINWNRKKRDYVDDILMKESHEEESSWTNYSEDEVIVKNEVALGILNSLLDETVQIILSIRKIKLKSCDFRLET